MPVPARSTVVVLLAAALTLTACAGQAEEAPSTARSGVAIVDEAPSAYHGTLVGPSVERPRLTLHDTEGRPFSLGERPPDEVTVVFFGYTHCPDVCPTTMADLAAARRELPTEIRDRVTVAFVTEDPRRDSPAVLRRWLDGFDPDFMGLRGGNADTQRVLEELYLPKSKRVRTPSPAVVHPEDGHEHPGDYGLEHAGIVYAFGPAGTVLYTGGTTPREYAEDLERLANAR